MINEFTSSVNKQIILWKLFQKNAITQIQHFTILFDF